MTYATIGELASWLAIDDSYDDDTLSLALDAAIDCVNDYCGRVFTVDGTVTVRTMQASNATRLLLRPGMDVSTVTGLIVKTDDNDDGTYETTWTIGTDFVAVGADQYGYNGDSGWPITELRAVGTKYWPTSTSREAVQITAKFGWTAVPKPVKQATLIMAAEGWKLKDTPFGVAGFGEFGPLRVRDNPMAAARLKKYVHPIYGARLA